MPDNLTPLVSVAMITYGHEKYVAHSIEGIINQKTNFPFELVIGTDCSPDKTDAIVAEYIAKYPDIIRVVSSNENVGSVKNFNRTQAACRGKYLAYCEGDDYWHDPNKLQMQVDILEKDPKVGLVHCDLNCFEHKRNRRIYAVDRIYGFNRKSHYDNMPLAILTGKYNIVTCTVCLKKEVMQKIVHEYADLFDEKFKMGDVQRWAAMSTISKIRYIDRPMATYNILTESASHSKNIDKVISFDRSAFAVILAAAKRLSLSDNDVKTVIRHGSRIILLHAALHGRSELAEEILQNMKAAECSPKTIHKLEYLAAKNTFYRRLLRLYCFAQKTCKIFLREWRKVYHRTMRPEFFRTNSFDTSSAGRKMD